MKKPFVLTILLVLVSCVMWYGAVRIWSIPEYLLPGPLTVLTYFMAHFQELAYHTAVTLAEALIGFLIANILAISAAIGVLFVPGLAKAVMPFAISLKTTPIVAMAPLLLLWFGTGMAPKVAAAALICFFPALVNSLTGFNSLLEGEADLFHVYGAAKGQILMKLQIPRAAPYIFAALKVSSSLCIVGAIVGEFVGANHGIGYLILVSSYHLETVRMFSALFATAIAGTLLYVVLDICGRKYVFWQPALDEMRVDSPASRKSPR